jgi:hypothetical protein
MTTKSRFEAASGPRRDNPQSNRPALTEQNELPSTTTKLLRVIAWSLIAAIVALSFVPPFIRPMTGTPHDLEHISIFVLAGSFFGVAYRFNHLYHAFGFVVFAGAIEIGQLAVPGRHARIADFIVDAVSACAGVLAAWTITKTMSRWKTIG